MEWRRLGSRRSLWERPSSSCLMLPQRFLECMMLCRRSLKPSQPRKEQTSRSKKHRTPNKMSSKRPTPRRTVFKMTKVKKLYSDALAYLQDCLGSGPLVRCLARLASEQRDWEGTMGHPHSLLASLLRLLQPSRFFLQAPEVPTQLQAPSPNHPAHTACAEVASTPDHFLYDKQSKNCKEKTGEMQKLSRNCENCPGWEVHVSTWFMSASTSIRQVGRSNQALWPTCKVFKAH